MAEESAIIVVSFSAIFLYYFLRELEVQEQSDYFYLSKDEPNKSCLLALRRIILEQDSSIVETQKYGMPCFCYKGKGMCYLWIDKKRDKPYILIVDGLRLVHPELE